MPIQKRWWTFVETVVDFERDEPGVYELGDNTGMVVYIGSSNQLRRRLKEHLREPDATCAEKHARQYRLEYTTNYEDRERQLHDEHVQIYGRPPICNDATP
jgi:predicted GIY-YIG superfamily endonuclease